MMPKLIVPLFMVFLFSCSEKKTLPKGILPPSKMESVFWDYLRADVYTKDFILPDTTRNDTLENLKLQKRIFAFYKISSDDFYKSYAYYTSHPALMNTLLDSMVARQSRKKIISPQTEQPLLYE